MARQQRFIDLTGYERLHDVERRIWYSPAAIVLGLIGLAAAAYTFWGLSRGFILPHVGYGVFLATYGLLFAYYFWYRFQRVKCPGCDQIMQPYVTDVDVSLNLKLVRTVEIGGRHYREPWAEDDRRPWVRLMWRVCACEACKTYVNCSRLYLETCTDEELAQIRQRVQR